MMDFLKRLGSLFSSTGSKEAPIYLVKVRCGRCGEIIESRVNLRNDLSVEYGEGEKPVYFTRKVIVGEQGCYQPIEVRLSFNEQRRLIDQEISGGTFVDEE
jgi:hypothetical protein